MVKRKEKGSITVFLTLLFTIILSLTVTILESARVQAATAFAKRNLGVALNSVMSHYGKELWEDYHLFFLYPPSQGDIEGIKEKINRELKFMMKPEQNIIWNDFKIPIKTTDLIIADCTVREIKEVLNITENSGKELRRQAAEYMKYKEVGILLEKLLNQKKETQEMEQAQEVRESQETAEMAIQEMQAQTVKLMEVIDGVTCKNGRVKGKKRFVKMMISGTVSMQKVKITSKTVYQKVSKFFIDIDEILNDIIEKIEIICSMADLEIESPKIEDSEIKPSNYEEAYKKNYLKLESMKKNNSKKNLSILGEFSTLKEKKENKAKNPNINDSIYSEISGEKNENSNAAIIRQIIEENKRIIMLMKKRIENLGKDLRDSIDKAITILEEMEQKRKEACEKTQEYEKKLSDTKNLPSNLLQAFEEEVKEMKKTTNEGGSNEWKSWKNRLEGNRSIAQSLMEYGKYIGNEKFTYESWMEETQNLKEIIKGYSLDFSFHYGEIEDKETVNPITFIKELTSKGILNLLIEDNSKISEKSIEGEKRRLVSNSAEKEIKYETENNNDFLLFLLYLREHFKDFTAIEPTKKETALDYELEYLVGGKYTDKENLKGICERILGIRTAANLLYLITDKEISSLAEETAIILTGFLGMPPVIYITKMAILAVLALEEGLIDTKALLEQRNVPMFKSKKTFQMKYQEIVSFNKQMLKRKAEAYPKTENRLVDFDYSDYLLLFLVTKEEKLNYRTLDLIQSNLCLRYTKDFEIKECIYGFMVEAVYRVGKKIKMEGRNYYEFPIEQGCQYN